MTTLTEQIQMIERNGGDRRKPETPLYKRLWFVDKVFRVRVHLWDTSKSHEERHLDMIKEAILDLAYCGGIEQARYYADRYWDFIVGVGLKQGNEIEKTL